MKYKKKMAKILHWYTAAFSESRNVLVPPSFNRDWKSVNVENGGFNDIGYMRALRV